MMHLILSVKKHMRGIKVVLYYVSIVSMKTKFYQPFIITFINDLIVECYESGFGASYFEIIMCIIGFCDDIGLMSSSIEDLQALLNICYE